MKFYIKDFFIFCVVLQLELPVCFNENYFRKNALS